MGQKPQLLEWYWNSSGGSAVKTYVNSQDAPTFSSPATITSAGLAVPGFLFKTDMTGKTDALFSGSFTGGVSLNAIDPIYGSYYRFSNIDANVVIGTSSLTTASALSTVNGTTTYVEYLGRSQTEPLILRTGSGMSGMLWLGKATSDQRGSILRARNIRADNIGYAGLLASDGTAGREYSKIFLSFVDIQGVPADYANGGEGFYTGNVSSNIRLRSSSIANSTARNMARELIQRKWCDACYDYNLTGINVGQVTGPSKSGQDHGVQVEASNGGTYNFIVDGAPRPFNVFTHGYTYKNGTIVFTETTGGYIGSATTAFPGDPRLNGQPIVFDGMTFVYKGSTPGSVLSALTAIDETTVQVQFINCTLVNISNITSNDASHTNLVKSGNTFVTVPDVATSIYQPTYLSTDITSPDYAKVTSNYHYYLGQGAKTPPPHSKFILDAKEVSDISVAYNTSWGSISLPSTATFITSDGLENTLSVTWSQGSYSATTPGDVTVYGTPTTITGITDPFSIKVSRRITVGAAPVPDKHVYLNFTGTSGFSYPASGNYNTLSQSFSTGVITPKDNSGTTLASLQNTEGTLTGYQVSITSQFQGESIGQNSNGIFPDVVNRSNWTNPGASGNSRVFTITGLNNSLDYTVKLLGSVGTDIAGSSHLCTYNVTGATSPGAHSNIEIRGNVNTTQDWTLKPTGGVITITLTKTATGSCAISAAELIYTP